MLEVILNNGHLVSAIYLIALCIVAAWQALKNDRVVSNNIAIQVFFSVCVVSNLVDGWIPSFSENLSYDQYSTLWHLWPVCYWLIQIMLIRFLHKIHQETMMHLATGLEWIGILSIFNFLVAVIFDVALESSAYKAIGDPLRLTLNFMSVILCYFVLVFNRHIQTIVIWLDAQRAQSIKNEQS